MSRKAQPVGPDDVGAISIPFLAEREQHAALAAIAVMMPTAQPVQGQSMQALAAAAARAEGFAWWWRTVKHLEPDLQAWMASIESLPSPLVVPSPFDTEVEAFLLVGSTTPPGQRHMTADDHLRTLIYGRIAMDDAIARRIALAAVTETQMPQDMMARVWAVLGEAKDPELRRHLVGSAVSVRPADLALLQMLSAPWSAAESDAVATALLPLLSSPGDRRLDVVAQLLRQLEPEKLAELLLVVPAALPRLIDDGMTARLGGERLRAVVEAIQSSTTGDEAVRTSVQNGLVRSAEKLEDGRQEFATWASGEFGNASLGVYFERRVALLPIWDAERWATERRQLLRLHMLDPTTSAEAALSESIHLEDVDVEILDGGEAGRLGLGMVLGRAAARLGVERVVAHLQALDAQKPTEAGALIAGTLVRLEEQPSELVDLATKTPAGVAALFAAGRGPLAVGALRTREASTDELVAAVEAIASGIDGRDAGATEDELLALIHPPSLTRDYSERLIAALGTGPQIAEFTWRMLATLPEPEARQVDTGALATLLAYVAGSQHATVKVIDGALLSAARVAVHLPGQGMQAAAAAWLATAPLGVEVLQIVIDTAESHVRDDNAYVDARRALAKRYVARAEDPAQTTGDRADDLRSAARAAGSVARACAFRLATSSNIELRRVAAEILASTAGSIDEIETLRELQLGEHDRAAAEDLRGALRRIQSGDVGAALHNLIGLLGLPEVADAHLRTYLPHAEWDDTFISCVDKLRSGAAADPEDAAAGAIRLGEHLVLMAVADTLAHGNPKQQKQSADLIAGAVGKPEVGTLMNQQDLIQKLPWLHAYATLRQHRSVHPAPAGSTQPTPPPESVSLVLSLMRDVVAGWMKTMRELPTDPVP
ncbi:hypothetical protein ASE38_01685 [Cellulomonas sp. Root930]|nr:hypothetical protein ASE38_01685 [Cellulomonas sp. Root930]